MKITVGKEQLLERLADIQSIVERKTTMPILSHFLLNISKKGTEMSATDLETAMKEPLSVEKVDAEGNICIPARKLFEIVKEVDGEIILSTDDSEWIRIKAGASNFRLACLRADEFPKWPIMEEGQKMKINASALLSMIEKTLYSAGENDTRYTLNGLLFHLKPEEKKFIVVGTDGHRLAAVYDTLDSEIASEVKVIVPRKAASELKKFLGDVDGDITLIIGKNHIQFDIGEVQFLTRQIEGSYPNYDQVIPSANEKVIRVNRSAFIKALRRASVMSREKSNAIKVDIRQGLITVTASNPELGEAKDEVGIEYAGDDMSIGFNARYLLDALSALGSEDVVFEIQDPLNPTLLKEGENEGYLCVIMPMRT